MSHLIPAGRVGVPRKGERICPRCKGAGKTAADVARASHASMAGCDRCDGTGVLPELRVGDREPMPKRKLDIRPSSNADDPASSPSGVFRNGRGK